MLEQLDALASHSPLATTQLINSLSESADPDLALQGLCGIAEALHRYGYDVAAFARTLEMDDDFRRRLVFVLGASEAFGRHLEVHPRHWYDLADPALAAVRPTPDDVRARLATAVDAPNPVDALRIEYRRLLLRLAARDLAEGLLVDEVAAVLADLAGGALETALHIARNAYFAAHPGAADCRLAIIAMGKCGGRELNYVSDVDVLFVAEPHDGDPEVPALKTATHLAAAAMRICSSTPARAPSGRSTPPSAPKASPARWSAPSTATSRTTNAGRRPGSSRPCSRRARSPATPSSASSTPRRPPNWSGPRPTVKASSTTSRPCAGASSTTSRRPTSTAN